MREEYDSLRETPFFRFVSRLDAPYLPSPLRVVRAALELAEPRPGELLVDMGCGDGRVLVYAAREYGLRGRGYEIDPALTSLARERVEREGLEGVVEILEGDLLSAEVGDADLVYVYLTPRLVELVWEKLLRECKRGCRAVFHDYAPSARYDFLVEVESGGLHVHKLYLYRL